MIQKVKKIFNSSRSIPIHVLAAKQLQHLLILIFIPQVILEIIMEQLN